jgi:hypothetical protein
MLWANVACRNNKGAEEVAFAAFIYPYVSIVKHVQGVYRARLEFGGKRFIIKAAVLSQVPDDLKDEIQFIGRLRVSRYQRWVLKLLTLRAEAQEVISRLEDKGFSPELAEWLVYYTRESMPKDDVEEELADFEEPPVTEVAARAVFSATVLVFLAVLAQGLQKTESLAAEVLAAPLMMVGALAALGYFGLSVADLWERWRTRKLYL